MKLEKEEQIKLKAGRRKQYRVDRNQGNQNLQNFFL